MTDILPFTNEDLDALVHLTPPDWGNIIPAYQQYLLMDICSPFKLISGTEIIGVGAAIDHGMTGWLGHIMIHPAYRSKGYGTLITDFLINFLKKRGVATILLNATELGEPVYAKLGFRPDTQYKFYQKESSSIPELKMNAIVPCTNTYYGQVLELDMLISGEQRSKWIIPHLNSAMVCLSLDHVRGFYLPHLGDGLIYAIDADAGCALMEHRLQDHAHAMVPENNEHAISLLERNHFTAYRTARRMYLGPPHSWKPESVYNRISGALG